MENAMDMVKYFIRKENTRVIATKEIGIVTIDMERDHTSGKMEVLMKANGA